MEGQEGGPRPPGGSGGGGGGRPESALRAGLSAGVTLTLAILGSSVLPVPFAFSRLGVAPGLALMAAVAGGNALAGTLLLRAAAFLGKHSFEGLAEAVGGRPWRVATQVALILLLFGNLCGDLCLLADMGSTTARQLFPGGAPAWLVAGGGRAVMAALTLAVVLPLSCLRGMRELERVASAGFLFVLALAAIFAHYSLAEGLPALASGELPLWRPAVAAAVPEAVGVLSFAFYLTPLLLPLLREMPPGRLGVDLTCRAVQVVSMVVAYGAYAVIGLFAAARYGLRTEGDIMMNAWLPGRHQGGLGAGMTLYLSVSAAPMAMALRAQLENLLQGEDGPRPRGRQLALTAAAVLASLALALAFPTASEKMFAVTGATAVCAVCYVLPVLIHLRLYLRPPAGGLRGSASGDSGGGKGGRHRRSFSFDRLAAAAAAQRPGSSGGGGTDARWLLAHDHLAAGAGAAAALEGHAPLAADALAPAAPGQAQPPPWQRRQPWRQQHAWQQEEEEGEEGGAAAAAALLRGHQGTDLSLNRWLIGQSYDSMHAPESPTLSPRHGARDSLDSQLAAAGSAWDWPDPEQQQQQQQQQQQGGAGWPPDEQLPLPLPPLPTVPEGAEVAAAQHGAGPWQLPGGAGYPCLAEAGTGAAAAWQIFIHLVVPVAVLVLGVASSASALLVAVAALQRILKAV